MKHQAEQCAGLINQAKVITVLTGAGISTNAGIPDFRGPKGLYVTRQYDPDTVFNIDYFLQDPKPFFDFARDFIGLETGLKPTFTHRFLAKLEKFGQLDGIITQNIDSLHHKAGADHVLEMHGSFWESFCLDCGSRHDYDEMKGKLAHEDIPTCTCGGVLKPDIVFFGEEVKYFAEASALAHQSDLFLVIGTSCVVYPAASLPGMVPGKIIIVNKGEVHLKTGNVVLEVQSDIDEFFKIVAQHLHIEVE